MVGDRMTLFIVVNYCFWSRDVRGGFARFAWSRIKRGDAKSGF